jgi:hypothetical protein
MSDRADGKPPVARRSSMPKGPKGEKRKADYSAARIDAKGRFSARGIDLALGWKSSGSRTAQTLL